MTEGLEALIRRQPLFDDLSEADLKHLAGCARNVKFDAGEIFVRHGEEADRSFLVRAGRVGLVVHGRDIAETAEEGDLVGWSWLFPPYRWHFDAKALTAVRAIELDGACLRAKCESDPRFGFEIAKRFLYQAHRRLEHTRLRAMDVYKGPLT
ncbi:MAG: cyclic nucleotide-binding domain-containing protein [Deltaproteobacteria bacterium]|nr:MAG: cyclic nucleotide-binding domain-containing protein [Deltaproteobacteria bacterium]